MTYAAYTRMRPWVADVIRLCAESGPQTSSELAAFVQRKDAEPRAFGHHYAGRSLAPNEILLRLRARRDLVVEVVSVKRVAHPNGSTRLRDQYMVRLREPADDIAETT